MLMETVLFMMQAIMLLVINAELHMTLSGIFKPAQFTRERRFLKCTLVVFTMSYMIAMVRTLSIYLMIHKKSFHIKKWLCENNFLVDVINLSTFCGIDIIPIFTIFYLHWKNFREEEKKEILHEQNETEKTQTMASNTATKNSSFA